MPKLAITQLRSGIGALKRHKTTLRTLGLGRVNSRVVHEDTPQIRGMVNAVRHLVGMEVVDEAADATGTADKPAESADTTAAPESAVEDESAPDDTAPEPAGDADEE